MGKRHAFNLAHGFLTGVRLRAVCDIDDAALEWCKKFTPRAKRYRDYREMLKSEKLDGVIIATPHYSHEEIAVYAVGQGVNTLVEKPLAVTAAAAERIAAAAEAHPDTKVGVSFNQRSNRMYKRAKKLLSSGKLGDIQRVNFTITDWYRSQAYYNQGGWRASYTGEGGGCLINQCIHQLDILQWLVGMPSEIKAYAYTRDRNITVENDVTAIMKFGDYECAFTASTHELKGVNRLEIACDRGRVEIGRLKMTVYRHKSQKTVNAETKRGYGFAPSRASVSTYGFFTLLKDLICGQQLRSLRAFAKSIRGKGEMLASADEGARAVRLFNAIYYSAWKGEEVALPVDCGDYERELQKRRQAENNTEE